MLFSLCAKLFTCSCLQVFMSTGKVSALVLQVLATQARGIMKLAFSMCLHHTAEAHINRNRAHCLQLDSWQQSLVYLLSIAKLSGVWQLRSDAIYCQTSACVYSAGSVAWVNCQSSHWLPYNTMEYKVPDSRSNSCIGAGCSWGYFQTATITEMTRPYKC